MLFIVNFYSNSIEHVINFWCFSILTTDFGDFIVDIRMDFLRYMQ